MSNWYEVGSDGWLVGVERRPHPPGKRYSDDNTGVGMAWHSMEGSYAGSLSVLDSARGGSWKFSVTQDGRLVQHCPVQCSCWASGNSLANTALWATESEGRAGQPLSEAQVQTCLRLIRTWERYTGRKATREGGWGSGRTMHEHREVATLVTPNAGPTACPSGRYAPLWAALEEDDMADKVSELNAAVMKRLDLINVASGDYDKMKQAHALLAEAGLVPKRD